MCRPQCPQKQVVVSSHATPARLKQQLLTGLHRGRNGIQIYFISEYEDMVKDNVLLHCFQYDAEFYLGTHTGGRYPDG